jgi:hypothetical protein
MRASTGVGVFQEYYQSNQLKDYSSQEVAWIPSLEAFMMFFGGLWIGRLYGKTWKPASIPQIGVACMHLTDHFHLQITMARFTSCSVEASYTSSA